MQEKLIITCKCGTQLKVAPSVIGKKLRCPRCSHVTLVSREQDSEPSQTGSQADGSFLVQRSSPAAELQSEFEESFPTDDWINADDHQSNVDAQSRRKKSSRRVAPLTFPESINAKSSTTANTSLPEIDSDETVRGPNQALMKVCIALIAIAAVGAALLVYRHEVAKAAIRTEQLLTDAKNSLKNGQSDEAMAFLIDYISKGNASEKAVAVDLKAQLEYALSDTVARETMSKLSDQELNNIETSGLIPDGRVTDNDITRIRSGVVRTVLPEILKERAAHAESLRLKDLERQRADEAAAIEEKKRTEAERIEEERKRIAEQEERKPRDGSLIFGEIQTFYERFIGKYYFIDGAIGPEQLTRHRDEKCFTISFLTLEGKKGTYIGGNLREDKLSVVVSEEMADQLLLLKSFVEKSTNKTVRVLLHVKIDYLDRVNEKYPAAIIEKMDVFALHPPDFNYVKAVTLDAKGGVETFIDTEVDQTKMANDVPNQPAEGAAGLITNSVGMKFVLVPAGQFLMGSPTHEAGRNEQELQHKVTLSNSFLLGDAEITQEQYTAVMKQNPSALQNPTHPVESVSWNDANDFCKKLTALPEESAAKRSYRLPTEAEWEYACRAGSTGAFCFGDSDQLLAEVSTFQKNSGDQTATVRSRKPNAFGFYDMHGNVYEWCEDAHAPYSSKDVKNPKKSSGPTGDRVLRGGSFKGKAADVRSATRGWAPPATKSPEFGLRIVLIQGGGQ